MLRLMKGAAADSERDIWFPCCATPKLDGIRCFSWGAAYSTSAKLLPNQHVQQLVASLPHGLDGELVAGDFNSTQSAVMRRDGAPAVTYFVFDRYDPHLPYWERVHSLPELPPWCVPLLPTVLHSVEELLDYETRCLAEGHEGVITRSSMGPYLHGRATLRSQYMIKLKRFKDSEARIVGFHEGLTNVNELEADAFGYAKRSGHKDGKVPRGTLGSLDCVDIHTQERVRVAGLDEATRREIWADKAGYLGCIITYKYQHASGCAPRFPRFKGFRHDI